MTNKKLLKKSDLWLYIMLSGILIACLSPVTLGGTWRKVFDKNRKEHPGAITDNFRSADKAAFAAATANAALGLGIMGAGMLMCAKKTKERG